MSPVTIITYDEKYKTQIGQLIVHIQNIEFNVPITLNDQPDLADIPGVYQKDNGNFWLAIVDGVLVGTIGMIGIGNKQACIRKMFVHKDYRGSVLSIAQSLLDTLLEWAKSNQMRSIYLGTIERLYAARRFYEKNGFRLIDPSLLPMAFPRMKVDTHFYTITLPPG